MSSRPSSLRIIVSGLVGAYPVGGVAWDYLQYVLGLARLGHDVLYHEDTWIWPFHPVENTRLDTATYSVDFLDRFFTTFAPESSARWHYRHLSSESFGLSYSKFQQYAKTADLYLNVSAANPIPTELGSRCVTAFLDTDPGYNQIVLSEQPMWSQNIGRWLADFRAHNRHLTYAENIGQEGCLIPELGVQWIATRMPIVLPLWNDIAPASDQDPWSTVMTWNDFRGPLIYRGQKYGSKGVEFTRIESLPSITAIPLRIALGGVAAPTQHLKEHGWQVVDAPSATLTPSKYRDFIARSRGEISIAKNVYVAMNTGWFSCRTACYLAAGRPAVVQDTGFSRRIPVGNGLFAFATIDQACAAIEAAERNYSAHASSAREVVQEYFDSSRVLSAMLDSIFATS